MKEEENLENINKSLHDYFKQFSNINLRHISYSKNLHKFIIEIPVTKKFNLGDVLKGVSESVKTSKTSTKIIDSFQIDYSTDTNYDAGLYNCVFDLKLKHSNESIVPKPVNCSACGTESKNYFQKANCIITCRKCKKMFCHKCNTIIWDEELHKCEMEIQDMNVDIVNKKNNMSDNILYYLCPVKNAVVMKHSLWKCMKIEEEKPKHDTYLHPSFSFASYLEHLIFDENQYEILLEYNCSVHFNHYKLVPPFQILLPLSKTSNYMVLQFMPTVFYKKESFDSKLNVLVTNNDNEIEENTANIDATQYCYKSLEVENLQELITTLENTELKEILSNIKKIEEENVNISDSKFIIGSDLNVYMLSKNDYNNNTLRKCELIYEKPKISFYANSFEIYNVKDIYDDDLNLNLMFYHKGKERNIWINTKSEITVGRKINYNSISLDWNNKKQEITKNDMNTIFLKESIHLKKDANIIENLNDIFIKTSEWFEFLKTNKENEHANYILCYYLKFLLLQKDFIEQHEKADYAVNKFSAQIFERIDHSLAHFYDELNVTIQLESIHLLYTRTQEEDILESSESEEDDFAVEELENLKFKSSDSKTNNVMLLQFLKKLLESNENIHSNMNPDIKNLFYGDSIININEFSTIHVDGEYYKLFDVNNFAFYIGIVNEILKKIIKNPTNNTKVDNCEKIVKAIKSQSLIELLFK